MIVIYSFLSVILFINSVFFLCQVAGCCVTERLASLARRGLIDRIQGLTEYTFKQTKNALYAEKAGKIVDPRFVDVSKQLSDLYKM